MLVDQAQFGKQALVEMLSTDALKPTPGFHAQNADRKAEHRTSQLSGSGLWTRLQSCRSHCDKHGPYKTCICVIRPS